MKHILLVAVFAYISFAVLFFFFLPAQAQGGVGVVLNEIAAFESSGDEWVEVYNAGSSSVDMTGWKFFEANTNHSLALFQGADMTLAPGEYAIIAQDAAAFLTKRPAVSARVFDSSWGSLSENGEEVGLKDASGVFIEQFIYIAAGSFSLERKDAALADYTAANWFEHPDASTPGALNDAMTRLSNVPASHVSARVVVNEAAPNPGGGGKEWIELYNASTSTADVNGWTIEDATNQRVASVSSTIPANGFKVVELSSARLNNGGDTIRLKDASGAILDEVTYGSAAGNAVTPSEGQSIARGIDGQDTGNDADDFFVTTSLTPGAANVIVAPVLSQPPPPPPSSSPGPSSAGSSYSVTFYPRDVVVNELFVFSSEENNEWIELYNATGNAISLDGWRMEDGNGAKTALNGSIDSKKFFIIEKPNGSLNNTGDMVTLFDPTGKTIDRVSYGQWNDGNPSDNAPAAGEGVTLARIADGKDTDTDTADFAVTSAITKGAINMIAAPSAAARSEGAVIVTELFPNPVGSDTADEFIELKNTGAAPVDLRGWRVGDETTYRYMIATTTMVAPGGYYVLRRSVSGIVLENAGGDEARLYVPAGTLAERVSYAGEATEGQSYARRGDDTWGWTASSTPGRENAFEGVNMPPTIAVAGPKEAAVSSSVFFDASDTVDAENDALRFYWDFGDGVQTTGDAVAHTYPRSGKYTVQVAAADGHGTSTKNWVLSILRPEDMEFRVRNTSERVAVALSEVFPNPADSEEKEFIELYNSADTPADLSGYMLDDAEGGSSPYRIPNGIVIAPHAYVSLGRAATKIALNNTSDAVRFFSPSGELLDDMEYDDAQNGVSYGRFGDDWRWGTPTPGEGNKEIETVRNSASGTNAQVKGIKIVGATTLEAARQAVAGSWVKVTGTVAVLPGVFGTQYFYIVGSPGIQVYMNKKEFPALLVGDTITAAGEISEVAGEKRVKVKQKGDIVVLSRGATPEGTPVEIAELDDGFVASLVTVTGEITQLKSTLLYVDDGTDELEVYFKRGAGIRKDALRLGERVRVTGMLTKTKDGFRLLPRWQSDIAPAGTVAGEKIGGDSSASFVRSAGVNPYVLATVAGMLVIAGAALFQRREMVAEWVNRWRKK